MKIEMHMHKEDAKITFGEFDYSDCGLMISTGQGSIDLHMSVETAELFLSQFSDSLEKFKRKKKIVEMTERAANQNDSALKRLED